MPYPHGREPLAFGSNDPQLEGHAALEPVRLDQDGMPTLPQDDLLAERLDRALGPRRRRREDAAVELEFIAAGRREADLDRPVFGKLDPARRERQAGARVVPKA